MYCYCVRYDNKLHHVVNIGTDTTEILPGYTNTVLLVEIFLQVRNSNH